MILSATLRRHRPLLLGHKHDAKTAFADLLQQLVGADDGARALGDWSECIRLGVAAATEEFAGRAVSIEQLAHSRVQLVVPVTRRLQKRSKLFRSLAVECSEKDVLGVGGGLIHRGIPLYQCNAPFGRRNRHES